MTKDKIRYILSKHYGFVDERTVEELWELMRDKTVVA